MPYREPHVLYNATKPDQTKKFDVNVTITLTLDTTKQRICFRLHNDLLPLHIPAGFSGALGQLTGDVTEL